MSISARAERREVALLVSLGWVRGTKCAVAEHDQVDRREHEMRRYEATNRSERLRETWPIQWRDVGLLLACYVALTGVWSAIGWMIVEPLDDTEIVRTDERIANWFVERRTPALDDWSLVGSLLAETIVKIVVTAIIVGILLWAVKRWLDPLVVAVSLILEAMVFVTVTVIVGRPRPDVERLDGSPVDSSFPSGHAAAAACYVAIAVVVFWHTRNRWIRALAVVLTASMPIIVGVARMYRGMHHLTDVIAGALLGVASVVLVTLILCRAEDRRRSRETEDGRSAARYIDPDDEMATATVATTWDAPCS
jgi:membrane-associated phospholipid phosphatase